MSERAEPRIEISPEPEPDEREAIVRAAARARDTEAGRSAWWREGVRDALRAVPSRSKP